MKINNVVNALVLSITIFAVEGIYAQDSFLLACKGKQWIETETQKFNITEYTKSYEIRNQQLIIPVAHSKSIAVDPINFGEHELLYHFKEYPQYNIIKDYYLEFDRISGSVREQYDSSVGKKVVGADTLNKFQGVCEKIKNKRF